MGEQVVYAGNGYAVVDRNGTVLSARYASRIQAEIVLDNRAKRASRRTRACLTCGKAFESEGIHNRMCKPCKVVPLHGDWMGM